MISRSLSLMERCSIFVGIFGRSFDPSFDMDCTVAADEDGFSGGGVNVDRSRKGGGIRPLFDGLGIPSAGEGWEAERAVLGKRGNGRIRRYTGLAQRAAGSRDAQVRNGHEAVAVVSKLEAVERLA